MSARTTLFLLLSWLALTACSTQQGYASAQAWRRNQCSKIVDAQERIRCLREADASFESYRQEADGLKAPR